MAYQATVKETGEKITVFKLSDGDYYDFDNMGEHQPPQATKAGKKKFKPEELIIGKETSN